MLDAKEFAAVIDKRLREMGSTKAGAARAAGLPKDAIRSVFRGHTPDLHRAAEICRAIGMELRIVVADHAIGSANHAQHSQNLPDDTGDRQLAELIAAIRAHWNALEGPYARNCLIGHLWIVGGEGMRIQRENLRKAK